jgi:hypothetical protein
MATVAEQAFSAVQGAFNSLGAAFPSEIKSLISGSLEQIGQAINTAQAAAKANPALQQTVLNTIDQSKAGLQQLRSQVAAELPADQKAQVDQVLSKFDSFLDAERDETINGPKTATPWYAEPGYIALWTLLGLLALSLLAAAIYYAVRGKRQVDESKEQLRERVVERVSQRPLARRSSSAVPLRSVPANNARANLLRASAANRSGAPF